MTAQAADRLAAFALGTAAFMLTVVQVPRLTSSVVLTGWAWLTILLPFMVGRVQMRLPHWLGVAFVLYAAVSVMRSPSGGEALWHLGVIAGCFCLGSSLTTLRPVWVGLALGLTVSSLIAAAQSMGWQGIPQVHPPAGLFVNKLVLGWACGLVLIALMCERLWWLVPGLLPGFVLTEGRGSVLAVGAALICWTLPRSRIMALVFAVSIAGLAVLVYKTNYRASSIDERMAIWADTAEALTPTGRGLGSFIYYFPVIDTRMDAAAMRAEHAHNDFLEFAFELGVGALPLFVLVLMLALSGGAELETERLVFIAYLVMAVFGFPTFIPVTAFVGCLVAGRLAGGWGVVRGPRHGGRPYVHPGRSDWEFGNLPKGRPPVS